MSAKLLISCHGHQHILSSWMVPGPLHPPGALQACAGLLTGFKHETLKMNPTELLQDFGLGSGIMKIKGQYPPPFLLISLTKLGESLFSFLITVSFFAHNFPPFQHPLLMLVMSEGVPTLFRSRTVILCS